MIPMKRLMHYGLLVAITLSVASVLNVTLPYACLSGELVILDGDEPIMDEDSLSRGELARTMISYFPKSLLLDASGGHGFPGATAPDSQMWYFLNRTGILPAFSDGSNHTDDTIRRSQMAIVLQNITRLLSIQVPETVSVKLPMDVDSTRYDAVPIREILMLDLMECDSLGRFRPDSPLTGKAAIEAIVSLSKFAGGAD
ncbi:MAG: hypothetical protein ACE5OP_03670 [Candidatus Glassbacteria bacterium]